VLFCLLAFPPVDVAVPAIIAHEMFSLVRDVGRDGCDPIKHGKHLEVALEDPVHL
jgi:hypothetical protein